MNDREELEMLRRLAALEAKASSAGGAQSSVEAEAKRLRQSLVDQMGTGERLLVGAGKAFSDIGRGVGQMFGAVSEADVAEQRKLEAPLMQTTAGTVGNVAGNIAAAIPAAFIPGGQTVSGAALTGAALGAMQPTTADESRVWNAAVGGAAGAGGVMALRGAKGLYGAGKALIEPFTDSGRNAIAGRMLQRFADKPQALAASRGAQTATGATPTLAEETADAGIARLQDALRSVDPQINNRIGQRLSDNNAARVSALQTMAGTPEARAAAETARQTASGPLYNAATAKWANVDDSLSAIMARPSFEKAMGRAGRLAAEQGREFGFVPPTTGGGPGQIAGTDLQYLKLAMDDMLKDPRAGIVGAEADAVKATRAALIDWMEKKIPEFGDARSTFRATSQPINAMDTAAELAKRATSNTTDLAGNPRMQANAMAYALRNPGQLIKQATSRNELKSLADVFTPDQLAMIQQIARETDRAAAVASAGAGPGSATAQRMASQNILRQMIGPTGLPESWAESVLANTVIGKPMNLIYGGVAEPRIQNALAEAVLNPQAASRALAIASRGPKSPNAIQALLARSVPSSGAAAALQSRNR